MSSLRVYLVENHEDTLRYMQLYLEQLNYKVFIAADMATALREIPESRCDVLISDIGSAGRRRLAADGKAGGSTGRNLQSR